MTTPTTPNPQADELVERLLGWADLSTETGHYGRAEYFRKAAARITADRARIEVLEGALRLAANRLQRCSVDYDTGTLRFIETGEWAEEALAVLTSGRGG